MERECPVLRVLEERPRVADGLAHRGGEIQDGVLEVLVRAPGSLESPRAPPAAVIAQERGHLVVGLAHDLQVDRRRVLLPGLLGLPEKNPARGDQCEEGRLARLRRGGARHLGLFSADLLEAGGEALEVRGERAEPGVVSRVSGDERVGWKCGAGLPLRPAALEGSREEGEGPCAALAVGA